MKILYLSGAAGPDYQCDLLFHGLRELLGPDVVDARRLWYMYQADVSPAAKSSLYGQGFTVYGRLPHAEVDRTEIEAKIRACYFDLVVYGSVWRSLDHFALVQQAYASSKIALIDGEDSQQLRGELFSAGVYFKRECTRASKCLPIHFAIPSDAVRKGVPPKTKALATVIPGRPETYVFADEQSYYQDYATSIAALTTKKAGWDCLRHYEILANGCVPLFLDVDRCPSHTMISLPKRFLRRARRWPQDASAIPAEAFEACRRYASERLTTRVLATNFLHAMQTGKACVPCTQLVF